MKYKYKEGDVVVLVNPDSITLNRGTANTGDIGVVEGNSPGGVFVRISFETKKNLWGMSDYSCYTKEIRPATEEEEIIYCMQRLSGGQK